MIGMEHAVSCEPYQIYFFGKEINDNHAGVNENDPKQEGTTSPQKPIKKILFVDDEKALCKIFKTALEKFGYEVRVAFNANEGMELFRESPADLIITDIFMPEKDGHTFINEIMQAFPETNIFAVTGYKSCFGLDMELEVAQALGAKQAFAKPVKIMELLQAIKNLDRA